MEQIDLPVENEDSEEQRQQPLTPMGRQMLVDTFEIEKFANWLKYSDVPK